jgi:hypothetical protein
VLRRALRKVLRRLCSRASIPTRRALANPVDGRGRGALVDLGRVPSDLPAELKATVLRGYVRWLDAEGMTETIGRDVSPALAEMLRDLPPPTQWLKASDTTLPLVEAVARRRDLATVRRMSREAAAGPIFTLIRPLVEGVLRLAMGPAGVVARLPLVLRSSARGIGFEVTTTGAEEAVLTMRTSGVRETRASAEAWAGAIEALLGLAHATPRIEVLRVKPDDATSEILLRIGWASLTPA